MIPAFFNRKGRCDKYQVENIEILDVSAFSINPCLGLERIVLHSHKHLETLLSLLWKFYRICSIDEMYMVLI